MSQRPKLIYTITNGLVSMAVICLISGTENDHIEIYAAELAVNKVIVYATVEFEPYALIYSMDTGKIRTFN